MDGFCGNDEFCHDDNSIVQNNIQEGEQVPSASSMTPTVTEVRSIKTYDPSFLFSLQMQYLCTV